ncbi:MAG TPA: redox-regulated ATPase YchF [Candidatus Omnitrophota bacterium]|nr:redox-regulated ATPase YchF [Candidatus Omnitrophota bacterium]
MEIGIVGLPNVGKSTLFNALTGAGAAAENFPFTTIEPNVGVVPLADERLNKLAEEFNSQKITPAGIRFVDIAGLVKGASQGEGLGNKFLSNIRSVDAVAHVVRMFQDENVINVLGELNPLSAAEIIETELLLADLQQAQKALEKVEKPAKSGDKIAKEKFEILQEIIKGFNEGKSARVLNVPKEINTEYQFLTAKPVMYVANTDESGASEELLKPLMQKANKENAKVVVLCTKMEAEIVELPAEERAAYYEAAGITSPGLARLAKAGQELLDLVCFFTAGPKEARAWLIPRGTMALKAAGKIHTDIERGFIRAEVYKYDDLMKYGSYKAVQEKGLVALEGKEYSLEDGDVVYFRFSV